MLFRSPLLSSPLPPSTSSSSYACRLFDCTCPVTFYHPALSNRLRLWRNGDAAKDRNKGRREELWDDEELRGRSRAEGFGEKGQLVRWTRREEYLSSIACAAPQEEGG